VPQQLYPVADDVVFLVASCLQLYELTGPVLQNQLLSEGFPPARIGTVVNGYEEDRCIDDVNYAFSVHDGWELKALYAAPLQ